MQRYMFFVLNILFIAIVCMVLQFNASDGGMELLSLPKIFSILLLAAVIMLGRVWYRERQGRNK